MALARFLRFALVFLAFAFIISTESSPSPSTRVAYTRYVRRKPTLYSGHKYVKEFVEVFHTKRRPPPYAFLNDEDLTRFVRCDYDPSLPGCDDSQMDIQPAAVPAVLPTNPTPSEPTTTEDVEDYENDNEENEEYEEEDNDTARQDDNYLTDDNEADYTADAEPEVEPEADSEAETEADTEAEPEANTEETAVNVVDSEEYTQEAITTTKPKSVFSWF